VKKDLKFCFGIFGNKSKLTFTGNKRNNLINGDVKSKLNPSFIICFGIRKNKTKNGNLKFLLYVEVYYNKIYRTITQSNRKYYTNLVL